MNQTTGTLHDRLSTLTEEMYQKEEGLKSWQVGAISILLYEVEKVLLGCRRQVDRRK